jgi:hypothetical protein
MVSGMTVLTDNFSSDTGQITTYANSGATPGSAAITGSQLVLTAPGGGGISGLSIGENPWPIPAPSLFISTDLGSPSWAPGFPTQNNYGPGIVKDGNNQLWFAGGPAGSTTTMILYVFGIFAGSHVTFINPTITIPSVPDGMGIGLVNNTVTAYLSFGGVWQAVSAIGSVDVSGAYDFTAGGALTGWNPGLYWEVGGGVGPTSIAAHAVQYTQPFADPTISYTVPNIIGLTETAAIAAITAAFLTLGTVTAVPSNLPAGTVISANPFPGSTVPFGQRVDLSVAEGMPIYGKFVPAPVFPPVMVLSSGLIEPRIWMPKENVTVRT